MIRAHILQELTQALGAPRSSSKADEWWIISRRPWDKPLPVHVCLNSTVGLNRKVHVLVFDPSLPDGFIELWADTMAEADAVIHRIKHITDAAEPEK